MRKISVVLLLILCSFSMHAQYKKASFLNKTGRTYELGGAFHFIGKSGATVPGIYYSFGKDAGSKRVFHWYDFEVDLPTTYKYTTTNLSTGDPVSVNGKSNVCLLYRYNLGVYLMDNSKENAKILPFFTAGFNFVFLGAGVSKNYFTAPDSYPTDLEKAPQSDVFSMGTNLGAGAVYNFTKKLGLKCTAGYNLQYNLGLNSIDLPAGQSSFYMITSHPYATLGIRLRMERDSD